MEIGNSSPICEPEGGDVSTSWSVKRFKRSPKIKRGRAEGAVGASKGPGGKTRVFSV